MSLELYFHPLASFCWKVLIALYENETPFQPRVIDLGNVESRAALTRLWPFGKFPVLHDHARDQVVAETSIIIEYLSQHYPGPVPLLPGNRDLALEVRFQDRFYDHYVDEPMSKIVTDKIRPHGKNDPHGVEQARQQIETAYALIEATLATRRWAAGDVFTLADCSAAPALYYANLVLPIGEGRPNTSAYLTRLIERPSFRRVVAEAQPYFHLFPG